MPRTLKEYSYRFEGEYGAVQGEVEAYGPKDAANRLAKKFPEDIGSDGELTGDDYDSYLDW